MKINSYVVKFSKYFVNGNLQGLMIDTSLGFPTLDLACAYVAFLRKHVEKPVKSLDSSNYTCHMARIETYQNAVGKVSK